MEESVRLQVERKKNAELVEPGTRGLFQIIKERIKLADMMRKVRVNKTLWLSHVDILM